MIREDIRWLMQVRLWAVGLMEMRLVNGAILGRETMLFTLRRCLMIHATYIVMMHQQMELIINFMLI